MVKEIAFVVVLITAGFFGAAIAATVWGCKCEKSCPCVVCPAECTTKGCCK